LCSCFTCYRSRRPSASANNTPAGTVNGAFEGDSDDNAGAAGSISRTPNSSSATSQPGAARSSLNDMVVPRANFRKFQFARGSLNDMAGSTSDGAGTSTDAPTSPSSAKSSIKNIKISNWRQRGANVPFQNGSNPLDASRSAPSDASSASSSPRPSIGSEDAQEDTRSNASNNGCCSSGMKSRCSSFFQRWCSCFNCYRSRSSSTSSSNPPFPHTTPAGTINSGFEGFEQPTASPGTARRSSIDSIVISNWRQRGANFPHHQQTTNSLASYASSSNYFSVGSIGCNSVFESPDEDATSRKHTPPPKKTRPNLSFKTKPEDKKGAATESKGSMPTPSQSGVDSAGPSSQQPSAAELEELKEVLADLDKALNKQ
ncbi:MAG: hypothetical protein ACRC9R_10595, partial [Enterovibrio sp.]